MKTLSVLLLTALTTFPAMSSYAQSPGELVGYTQYDYQVNFSTGHRIDVDTSGGVHVTWMRSTTYPTGRRVVYAYRDLGGNWRTSDLGSGNWPQIAVSSQYQPGIALHNTLQRLGYWTPLFRDTITDLGMWPFVAIDRNDHVHCIYWNGDININLNYTRSIDGGRNWTVAIHVDTFFLPSYVITASKVSNKVAIVYLNDLYNRSSLDIFYIQSLDGQNWDWVNGRIKVTQNDEYYYAYGYDCDAVYDFNDNLHIIWNFQHYEPLGSQDTSFMYHYDVSSDVITEIAKFEPDWPAVGCDFGSNNSRMTKMSIGASVPAPSWRWHTRDSTPPIAPREAMPTAKYLPNIQLIMGRVGRCHRT